MPRILIIEDETPMRTALKDVIENEGYRAMTAADGESGLKRELEEKPDLILLDVMMPKLDGYEVCAELRRLANPVPILMLTAKGQIEDRVSGLDAGADDYVSKPCVLRELEARVKALIRRKHEVKNPLITVADLVIDTSRRAVTRAGKAVPMTPREYGLLEFLALKAGTLVTRQEIWENLYAMDTSSSSNVVDVYIGYLRKKLEWPGVEPLIHTRRGVGFILGVGEGAS